jgi:hypothetical protein
MKHFFSVAALAASALWLTPAAQAQDCSGLTLWDTRGTYAMQGTAWTDMSTLNPALPKGYAPVSMIGAYVNDGKGGGTGWALLNAGGVQMTIEFVNAKWGAPNADCSQPFTYSMKIKESGVTVGPISVPAVIASPDAGEVFGLQLGTGPGSMVASSRARRISLKFN